MRQINWLCGLKEKLGSKGVCRNKVVECGTANTTEKTTSIRYAKAGDVRLSWIRNHHHQQHTGYDWTDGNR